MKKLPQKAIVIGIDTGGTFTDIIFRDGTDLGRLKLLSTPDDPARAVLDGLKQVFGDRSLDELTYGTTVATNAMLERRGARTLLITTAGFEDIIEIGRQARPDLYDLQPVRPQPLIPAGLRVGARERVLHDGSIQTRLAKAELDRIVGLVAAKRAESVAVCLLHAPANPDHERKLERGLRRLGIPVTLSHELSPEIGEYERTNTVAVNAFVRPNVASHLEALRKGTRAVSFRVMQSNGGAIGAEVAAAEPIRTMLSGPAGGVMAAARVASEHGLARAITFDMGGTSSDVALIDGEVSRRITTDVGGVPVRSPCVDIHTVGAGGGSIAALDEGASLKVGPLSAGADPGPACYGRGTEPTVTDANLVLGRLRAEHFLGGGMQLDPERSRKALSRLARKMGATSAEQAAEGVIRVVEANMERAIRVITVERGQDPRTCALVAFGGAAALHACGLADGLGIKTILVPKDPGLLSAMGMMDGPVVRDVSSAARLVDPSARQLMKVARELGDQAARQVSAEGIPSSAITTTVFARARYQGQSLELEVPVTPGSTSRSASRSGAGSASRPGSEFRKAFDREHQRRFHYHDPDRPLEVSAFRATATGLAPGARNATKGQPPAPRRKKSSATAARTTGTMWIAGKHQEVPILARESLAPSSRQAGPAVVTEYSSTIFVAPGWTLAPSKSGALLMTATKTGRKAR